MVQDVPDDYQDAREFAAGLAVACGFTPGSDDCPDLDAVARVGPSTVRMKQEFERRARRAVARRRDRGRGRGRR